MPGSKNRLFSRIALVCIIDVECYYKICVTGRNTDESCHHTASACIKLYKPASTELPGSEMAR